MRFPIDKTLNKIFDEAEEEFAEQGISREQIKEIFFMYWYNARELMKSMVIPTLLFPKWGRYLPKITILKRLQNKIKDKPEHSELLVELTNTITRIESETKKRKRK